MKSTLPRTILEHARNRGERTALRRRQEGIYRDIAWKSLAEAVEAYGRGLLALGLGRGERVAIMAPNSPEWVYADLGAMACAAISVPVYHTETIEAARHILRDSGSRFLFALAPENIEELARLPEEIETLERVILLEGSSKAKGVLSLSAFLRGAEEIPASEFEGRLAEGMPDDLASIVYTSGTTGPPKGVMLSHGNFLSNIEACAALLEIDGTDSCLSFLPLSHVFERMGGYYYMLHRGAVIAYAESTDRVPANLLEVAPTVVFSVPRLYEKMHAKILDRIQSGSPLKRKLFWGARAAGALLTRKEQAGERPGFWLRFAATAARKVVFSALRKKLGGRLRFFVSGGAPLIREVAELFFAAGVPIYEGYGLTETSPVIAANFPGSCRLGTVGRPIPGVQVSIAEDGEILIKGPGVFGGYWRMPEETKEAFSDGWFRTGDIGEIDEDGFLLITDRKKDLIVTAGGENIAPQLQENLLKTDKFIANALVYGNGKPYLTALLVPDFAALETYARYKGLQCPDHCALVQHERILDLLHRRLDRLQAQLPNFQRIRRFALIDRDFSGDELTPTLKIKRKILTKKFQRELERLYEGEDRGIHDSGFCTADDRAKG